MEAGGKQGLEHRGNLGRNRLLAANQGDAFVAAHLLARSRNRNLEECQAVRGRALAQRRQGIGVAGAGAKQNPAGIRTERR